MISGREFWPVQAAMMKMMKISGQDSRLLADYGADQCK